MEPILKNPNGGIVSEEALLGEPLDATVLIGRGLPRALTPQEVVNGLKFLREQVFNEENIQQVENFIQNIATFADQIVSVWNAITSYIDDRRTNAGGMRSLDLVQALHEEGLYDLYDLIERALEQED